MPGPMSDSYDPEWSTGEIAYQIRAALKDMHTEVSGILGNKLPIYIGDLVYRVPTETIAATLTDKQWRIIRFALERAQESI